MINKLFNLPTLSFVGGESKKITMTLRNENGALYNVPGAVVRLTVVSFVNQNETPSIDKSGSGQAEIKRGEAGDWCECEITLTPEDTISMFGKYIYQIKISDVAGNVVCPQGIMMIRSNNGSER